MDIQLKTDAPSYEWMVYRCHDFAVQVRAWKKSDGFGWNVYALIYDSHPLFNDVERAMNLPFHKGATLDERIRQVPARGIRYDWQKAYEWLKVGSDYQHYQDEHFCEYDPAQGMPWEIKSDAECLVRELLKVKETEQ